MENYTEKKDNKKPFMKEEGQKFYFNDDGKLVVESNKGVWVDGQQYVKMYGNFTCNAKTIGIVINKFKGCNVLIKEFKNSNIMYLPTRDIGDQTVSVVNPTEEDNELLQELHNVTLQRDGLIEKNERLKTLEDMHKKDIEKLGDMIEKFNKLPWWKRMFKKVEV